MANDGGVWARLPQPNNGGGIWTKTSSGWVEIGGGGGSDGLEGLGNWAVISEVSGSPKRYAYNDGPGGVGGFDWVAFEWTADGELTSSGGLVDALLVGQGGQQHDSGAGGGGGEASRSILEIGTNETIKVEKRTGATGSAYTYLKWGGQSGLGDHWVSGGGTGYYRGNNSGNGFGPSDADKGGGGAAGPGVGVNPGPGLKDSITGVEVEYGRGGWRDTPATNNPGEGGGGSTASGVWGNPGVVIIRVPAAQAAGVDPGSWVTRTTHYAAVDAGVVVEVFDAHEYGDGTVTPLSRTDLVECDESVQVGWLFDGEGFAEPEPPAPSVFHFDFTKEYSVAGGANHWPMALRVNKTDLDGAEIDLTGWGQARLQFDGKDMTVTVTQIEESSTYWRFTFAEFVNEFDSRLSCEIEISQPAAVRVVESAVKTAVKSRRKKK